MEGRFIGVCASEWEHVQMEKNIIAYSVKRELIGHQNIVCQPTAGLQRVKNILNIVDRLSYWWRDNFSCTTHIRTNATLIHTTQLWGSKQYSGSLTSATNEKTIIGSRHRWMCNSSNIFSRYLSLRASMWHDATHRHDMPWTMDRQNIEHRTHTIHGQGLPQPTTWSTSIFRYDDAALPMCFFSFHFISFISFYCVHFLMTSSTMSEHWIYWYEEVYMGVYTV